MEIKILYDNIALNKKFSTGWGLSYLIDGKILFDTGEKPKPLLGNMKKAGVKISAIKAIVISHNHWDHTGGLWEILKENPKLKVYVCKKFIKKFKDKIKRFGAEVIEIKKFGEICKNIYTTGEIGGKYGGRYLPEQGLVLKTAKGLTVLTGCAHPGILKMVKSARRNIKGDIYLAIGGFHMMRDPKKAIVPVVDELYKMGIKKAAPTHCSGKMAMKVFSEKYEDDFVEVKVGDKIEI